MLHAPVFLPFAPTAPRIAARAAFAGGCLAAGVAFGLFAAAPASTPGQLVEAAANISRSPTPRMLPGPLPVAPLRVIDGDTFEARAPVWFGQEITVLVRVRGVDAPELNGRCPGEMTLAREASATLAEVLRANRVILTDLTPDKYNGRVVASAWVESGNVRDSVGDLLVAGGYARPYDGRARASWCS